MSKQVHITAMRLLLRILLPLIFFALTAKATKLFHDVQARIVGGDEVEDESKYPYYIRLEISGQLVCGASLIHPMWALTGAHCFNAAQPFPFTANHWITRQQYPTFGIDIHPQYQVLNDAGQKNFFNDIMLVRMASPIPDAQLVTLNTDSSYPEDGQELTVIGLGKTDSAQVMPPELEKLLEVQVNVISNQDCQELLGPAKVEVVDDMMICAGVEEGGKDSCEGDSGGPFVDENGVQVGIVSYGVGCGLAGFPGVYARVSNYMEWIESILCDDESIYADAGTELPAMCASQTAPPTPEPTAASVEPDDSTPPEPDDSTTPLLRREPRVSMFDYIPFSSGFLRTRACVDEQGSFEVDLGDDLYQGEGMESCAWLRENLWAQPRLCLVGNEFDAKCRETCDNCS